MPAADAVALVVAAVLAGDALLPALGCAAVVLCLLSGQGLHRMRVSLRVWDQAPRMTLTAMAAVVVVLPWTPPGRAVLLGVLTSGALVVVRGSAFALLRIAHRRGRLCERALIVGGGETADQLARITREHPEFGLRVVGFVDDAATGPAPLGGVAELPEVISEHRVDRVLICSPGSAELVTAVRALRADVWVVPNLPELGLALPRGCLDDLWGIPLLPLRRANPLAALGKRVFDLAACLLLGLVAVPLVLVFGGLSRGGALFRQWRVTRTDRRARVIKLRTLVDPGQRWAVAPGECTALARWLRATHLDELPQLLNVLRGEMSLVGPRPERPCYAARFAEEIPHYADRHRMTGGMTGWAQVHGLHGDTSIPDRARFDNQYVEYWSLWMDLVIVARTAAIVTGECVRAGRARPGNPRRRRPGPARRAAGAAGETDPEAMGGRR
ncbi:sugar transferase [Saccharopolyspora taberi]|uniref:Bacterial sugar transferase domain-containing protein n=1 Tax=Saccharopolyspora taberi TaxID=60895 RepID=A0ABN3V3L8_9PSEU